MTQVHGKGTTVLYNGVNLSGDLTSFDFSQSADTVDTSTMDPATNQDHKFIVGMRNGTMTSNAIWNDAAGAIDETIIANLGATGPFCGMFIPNNTENSRAYAGTNVILTSYNVSGSVSDAVKAVFNWQSSGGFLGGMLLHEFAAETTAASSTAVRDSGVDLTYPTTLGGRVVFIVTSITGGNVVMALQHATTIGGSYTTVTTLSTLTAPGVASAIIDPGTNLNEFVRATWTQTATTWTGALVFTRFV